MRAILLIPAALLMCAASAARAELASEASGQRGNSLEMRAQDTRPEPGSSARAGDAARGEKLYDDCVACHPVEAGVHGIGPTLHRIIGRKVGDIADYRYSRALRLSGITWTVEALDTFVGDPQASVPANRMPYAGMTDARDRADLIAYLQKISK
jgi:cytochrome c